MEKILVRKIQTCMKLTHVSKFLVLVSSIFSGVSCAMDIRLNMEKSSFDLKDRIEVDVGIYNRSEQEVVMPIFMVCSKYYLSFLVEGLGKNEAMYKGVMFDINITTDLEVSMPKDSEFRQTINLSDCYEFEKGEYKISAVYTVHPKMRASSYAWYGTLKSNELIFSID